MIKAVIFDMDGVLVDAKEWHYEALNRALNLYSQNIARKDHLEKFDGLPTKVKLDMLTSERGLAKELHTPINRLKQLYTIDLVHAHCKPDPVRVELLSELKKEGYVLGVASNSIRNSVKEMMELSGLDLFLDFQLSNEDVAKAKPDPEIYNKAVELTGFSKDECLILEDNKNGIAAAHGAGVACLEIGDISEVNYKNVTNFIEQCLQRKVG